MHARLHNFTDWIADTAHMTRTEKTIYFDLYAMYFTTEQAIDGQDMALLERRLSCVTDDEKQALAFVLQDKFKKVGERYKCPAWDNEIKNYRYRHRNERRNDGVTDGVTHRNETVTPLSNAERQQKARFERKKMIDTLTQLGVDVNKDMGLTELRKLYDDVTTPQNTSNDSVTEHNEQRNERNAKSNAITINHKPKTKNHKPINKDMLDFCFDAFWGSYPRKEGKSRAKDTLQKVLQKADDPKTLFEEIMAGLNKNLPYLVAQRDNPTGNFCKHPTTWLNAACWLDEPSAQDPLAVNAPWGQSEVFIPKFHKQEYDNNGNPIFPRRV